MYNVNKFASAEYSQKQCAYFELADLQILCHNLWLMRVPVVM